MYSSTTMACVLVLICCTNASSGAITIKSTPKIVSGRVVYTVMLKVECCMAKVISAPWLLPIQLRCISFMLSLKSTVSNPCSNLSAYSVILKYHCLIFFFTTGWPPLSLTPFTTSSLANTVPKASHQFTSPYLLKARRYSIKICCCFVSSNAHHSVAVKFATPSFKWFLFPSFSNCIFKSAIGFALFSILLK